LEWIYSWCANDTTIYKLVAMSGNIQLLETISPIPKNAMKECCRGAVHGGNIHMCDYLTKQGATKKQFAILAILCGRINVFIWACEQLKITEMNGIVPLAIEYNRQEILTWLMDNGVMIPMIAIPFDM
jgi:hypothetical protein